MLKENHEISGGVVSNCWVRTTATALLAALVLITFEGLAWEACSQGDYVQNFLHDIGRILSVGQLKLDTYKNAAPGKRGQWRLGPNFVATNRAVVTGKREGMHLIDLQACCRETLQSRTIYFPCHAQSYFKGLEEVGAGVASRLAKLVWARDTECNLEG